MQHHSVEAALQRRRDVAMHITDFLVRRTRPHESLAQQAATRRVVLALLTGAVGADQRDAHAAAGQELHCLFEERAEPLGVPVRREAHDLVLVSVEVEPQVQRDERIEDADRIVRPDLEHWVETAIVRAISRDAVRLAHAVRHQNDAFVPARRVERARRVRQVVAHRAHPRLGEAGQVAPHQRQQRVARVHLAIQCLGQGVQPVEVPIRPIIEAVHDLVHVVQRQPRLREAVGDRAPREVTAVLAAIHPLLGHRRHHAAVRDQHRRRVVALRETVLPLVQARPVRPLERDGALESTDSQDVQRPPP